MTGRSVRRAVLAAAVTAAVLAGDGHPLRARAQTPPAAPTGAEAPAAPPATDTGAAARRQIAIVSATLLQVQGDPPVARSAPARRRDRSVNPFDPESLRRFFED